MDGTGELEQKNQVGRDKGSKEGIQGQKAEIKGHLKCYMKT